MAFYEWWCPRCRVTHPPGRRVCVHCGGRVQTSRDAETAADPRALPGLSPPAGDDDAPAETSRGPEPRAARALRIGMTLVWVALAVLASVLRACQERG